MYKQDLALNNLQWSICYRNKPNQTYPDLMKDPSFSKFYVRHSIHLLFCKTDHTAGLM